MSRKHIWKSQHPEMVTDLFGVKWVITKRVDSGHGFDLLYGFRPRDYEVIDNPVRGLWHILDAPLRDFVLANLTGFDRSALPISTRRKERLRRMFSSLRYKNIPDWEMRRDPSEPTFYVDQKYIDLPPLHDIHGQKFSPTGVRYFRPGFHIWTGMPAGPGQKAHGNSVVLTKPLADLLYSTADLKVSAHAALGLPMSMPVQNRLRREAVADHAPTLHSFKSSTDRARDMHIHPDYIDGAEVEDVFGKAWRIHRIQQSPDGDIVLRGSPTPKLPKGRPGAEYILTPEIAALFEEHYGPHGDKHLMDRLGTSRFVVRNLREKLDKGFGMTTANRFWIETLHDLLTLSATDFAAKYETPIKPMIAIRAEIRFLAQCVRGAALGQGFLDALNENEDPVSIANRYAFKTLTKVTAQRRAFVVMQQAKLIRRYAGKWQLTNKGQKLISGQ